MGADAVGQEEEVGKQRVGQGHDAHVEEGEMDACPRAILGRIGIVAAKALPYHRRQGDAGADEGHKGEAVDVEGEIRRRQFEPAYTSGDENEERKREDVEHEVQTAGTAEAQQPAEQFAVEAPARKDGELASVGRTQEQQREEQGRERR